VSYISVPRFAADIFTDNLLLMARSINPKAPTLFKATLSPLSKSGPKTKTVNADSGNVSPEPHHTFNTVPRKLEWNLTPEIKIGIRFAETRLSDLICQNDIQALEFTAFGKSWITKHSFSPDAFVQMAFQAGYYGLYGECAWQVYRAF
jgi:carnitine O-acetyltransferase